MAKVIQRGIAGIIPIGSLYARTPFSGVMGSRYISLKDVDSGLASAYHAIGQDNPSPEGRKFCSKKLWIELNHTASIKGSIGMLKRTIISFMWVMISACLSAEVTHAAMRLPNGCKKNVFLTITGKIDKITNSADSTYEMSEGEFLALPTSTVTTSTPWTPKSDFVGPLLTKILQEVAARGSKLRLVALDDFSVDVDGNYLGKYGTILASSKDGVRLTVRDFGPIFVMYPRDSFRKELDTPFGASHMVWQLCGIVVE